MAADDAPDAPDVPDPLLNPDGTRKKDLRYTGQGHGNVQVDRRLDGSGHLARGDKTRMSVLNFSARAQPRTERDPEFAFRPERGAAAPPDPAGDPVPPAAEPGADAPADRAESTVLDKIKRILGF